MVAGHNELLHDFAMITSIDIIEFYYPKHNGIMDSRPLLNYDRASLILSSIWTLWCLRFASTSRI